MLVYIVKVAVLFAYSSQVNGCGLSTHVEIGHIAATFFHHQDGSAFRTINFGELIWKHQDAFQAGNTYPDTYYSSVCLNGKYHEVSEDTHWTPFTNVTIHYIRDNLPLPWDDEAEKLVVFMLGFISHQVADIGWHSLGINQGFIQTMAAIDFHGDYSTAHTTADMGSDVINHYRGTYDYINFEQWYIPVQHLVNIYKLYYGQSSPMTAEVVEECTSLMFAVVLGETIAFAKLYPNTAKKSPFLTQQLDDYFLGGMYDMAFWTIDIWKNAIYLLENGFSPVCSTPENPLFIRCNLTITHTKPSKAFHRPSEQSISLRVQENSLIRKSTKHGVIIKPTDELLQKLLPKRQEKETLKTPYSEPRLIMWTDKSYAGLGKSMISSDINNDGVDDLIISAPLYPNDKSEYSGAVFVVLGSKGQFPVGNISIEAMASQTIYGMGGLEASAAKFGDSLAVLDINLDGYKDLVVSAPSTGWSNLTYQGEAIVYFGTSSGTFNSYGNVIRMDAEAPYLNMGLTLLAADIDQDNNDDLIIGSPMASKSLVQSGLVCFLKSSQTLKLSPDKCMTSSSEAAYSWFGSSLLVTSADKFGPVLIVGAPAYRKCADPSCAFNANDTQSVGQVTVWSLPDLRLISSIDGVAEHGHFGNSLAVDEKDDILAIGLHSADVNGIIVTAPVVFDQVGAVAVYKLSSFIGSANPQPQSVIYSDRKFSLFGAQIKFGDLNNDGGSDLIVSSPLYSDDISLEILHGEQGRVMVFRNITYRSNMGAVCRNSLVQPCPGTVASREYSFGEGLAQFGSSFTVMNSAKKAKYLVSSALRSSFAGPTRTGAVLIYDLP